jgi:hypothetical protein
VPKSARSRNPAAALIGCAAAVALVVPAPASAGSGGVGPDAPSPAPVAGGKAKLLPSGQARPPAGAPKQVQAAIAAANSIDDAGYCRGGGHRTSHSRCYDCSGAVSYVLGPEGADILDSPLDSGSLRRWGERGRGSWITVYTNPGHAYVVVAGLRFDTSIPDDGQDGPGWSKDVKAGRVNGPFQKRHFLGL